MSYQYTSQDSQRSPLDRQPQNVFSGGQVPSFKTNVNRMKTKRWIESKAPSYDDWDDYDDGYGPGPSQEQPALPPQPHNPRLPPEPARSFTDPHATAGHAAPPRRPSFDAGDDRRTFSSSAYPQPPLNTRAVHPNHAAQLAGGPTTSSPVAMSPTVAGGLRTSIPGQPYPSSNQAPQSDAHAVPGSRQSSTASWSQSVVSDAPSAQMEPQQRRDFTPSALPPPLQTRASPAPSDNIGARFPARESSLSQSSPVATSSPQTPLTAGSDPAPQPSQQRAASNTGKVIPIIRPADIYKRMEEERQKERRSMDSSRPSLDSVSSRATEDVVQAKKPLDRPSSESLGKGVTQTSSLDRASDDGDSIKPSRPTLEPVAERKSEYMLGFSLPKEDAIQPTPSQASPSQPQGALQIGAGPSPQVASGYASGTTASDSASKRSAPVVSAPTYQLPAPSKPIAGSSEFHPSLPEVSRFSTFGDDFWSGHQFSTQSPQKTRVPTFGTEERTTALEKPAGISGPVESEQTSRMLHDAHQIPRKPSPSPTHSRNVSTVVEPTDAPSQQQQAPVSPPPAEGTASPPQDLTMREADLAAAVRRSPEKEIETLASKEKESQATFLESQKVLDALNFGPSSSTSSPVPRAESPTKGRVKDLAGKFNDISDSRRSSTHSISSEQGNSSPTKVKDETSNIASNDRPAASRDPSFRPALPGQWDSFSSNAGPTASQPLPREKPVQVHEDTKSLSDEEIDLEPTTSKYSASPLGASSNQMSALAAAGAAMGEAINASASHQSGQEASSSEAPSASVPSGAIKNRAVGDIYVRPLAPERAFSTATASSVAPTPPPKENPMEAASAIPHQAAGPPVPSKDSSTGSSPAVDTEETNPIIPQLSTESSVDDQESDRLRKEIVRSLSPVQPRSVESGDTPRQSVIASESSDPTKAYRDSSVLPAEYDSYWAGADSKSLEHNRLSAAPSADVSREPIAQVAPAVQHDVPEPPAEKPSPAEKLSPEVPAPLSKTDPHRDFLGKRFSWEEPTDDHFQGPPAPAAKESALPPIPAAASSEIQAAVAPKAGTPPAAPLSPHLQVGGPLSKEVDLHPASPTSAEISPITTKEGEHPLAPRTESTGISPVALVAPQPTNFGRDTPISPLEAQHPSRGPSPGSTELQSPLPTDTGASGQAQAAQPRFPFFREILAMKSSPERITAYNKTREQFATSDSGLRDWLSVTLAAKPEHADLRSIGTHTSAPAAPPGHSRHKRTASLSLFGKGSSAPYYQQYIDSASQLQDSGSTVNLAHSPTTALPNMSDKPSAGPATGTRITGHQMQAKGKDLLHSAGVLGGKASTISKGLFAKGKSKFRSSGSEKAPKTPTSRKTSSERSVPSGQEKEKRRSISMSPFRRPRSRPSSIVIPSSTNDYASIHSQDTHAGSFGTSKRHSYAGESWHDFLPPPKSTTPERLGVLPSPAVSAFTASQTDLPIQKDYPPLPIDAQQKILKSVMRHSTPPAAEQNQRDSLDKPTRGSPALLLTSEGPGDVSPVDQSDDDEPYKSSLTVDNGQPLARSVSPLVPDQTENPGDVSPISDEPGAPADIVTKSLTETESDPKTADLPAHNGKNDLALPSEQAPVRPKDTQVHLVPIMLEQQATKSITSARESVDKNLRQPSGLGKAPIPQLYRSSADENKIPLSLTNRSSNVPQWTPLPTIPSGNTSPASTSSEPKRQNLLQSLSDAVIGSGSQTHNRVPSNEGFAVRVVAAPTNDTLGRGWAAPGPSLEPLKSSFAGNVSPTKTSSDTKRPAATKELAQEPQSPMSDDELYTDDGGVIPPPSKLIHEEIVSSHLPPPQPQIQEDPNENIEQASEPEPPRPPFLEKSSRNSSSSVESRPMSFVALPRDEAGMPQEQINRAPAGQPQLPPGELSMRTQHADTYQQLTSQPPANQPSEDVALHRYHPQPHSRASKGRRVSGSAPLPNLTHHEHRPIEPDVVYGSPTSSRGQNGPRQQPQAIQDQVIDPRKHSAEYQLPGVGPPATTPSEPKSRFGAFLRGKHLPGPANSTPTERINPQLNMPQPDRTPSYQSTIGDLQPDQTSDKDKRRSRTPGFFKSPKRPDSVGHESQLSGISGFTRDSITANATDSRMDLRYPTTPLQGIPPSAANSERKAAQSPQRASTSSTPDTNKKKRFSALGSLFKRSESTGHTPTKLTSKFSRSESKSKMPTLHDASPVQQMQMQQMQRMQQMQQVQQMQQMQQMRPATRPAIPPPTVSAFSAQQRNSYQTPPQQTQPVQPDGFDSTGQPPPPGGYYGPTSWVPGQFAGAHEPAGQQNRANERASSFSQASAPGPSYDANNAAFAQQQEQEQPRTQSSSGEPRYDTPAIPAAYNMNHHANGVESPPPANQSAPNTQWTTAWRRHSQDHGHPPHGLTSQGRQPSADSSSSDISRRVSDQSQTPSTNTNGSTPVISPVSSNSSRAAPPASQYVRAQAPRMNSISETAQHQERPWNISLPTDDDEDSDHSRRHAAQSAQAFLSRPNGQLQQAHPLSQSESQQQVRPQPPQLRVQTNTEPARRSPTLMNPQAMPVSQPPMPHISSATSPSSPMQRYREILPRGTPQSLQPAPITQPRPMHPLRTSMDRATSRGSRRSPTSAHPANFPLPMSPGTAASPINPFAVGFPAPPPPGQQHTPKSLEPRAGVQELPAAMDDDDEPVMRAVSYPGMEWAPKWEE